MKILRLILKGYNRLLLNNISSLEFTPERKIVLILGTNGSGKSSLIRELSPLPFDRKHFTDGIKEILVEHNNKKYLIKQVNNKFSFKEEGKELNVSGNRRVQIELIKDKLNYDLDMHKLLIGLNNFTGMSPTERKNLLIKLSNMDYEYSLAYFKRLCSRDRDIRGTIKVLSNKLVEEESLLIKEDVRDKYKEDLKVLDELYDMILKSNESIGDNNVVDDKYYIESIIKESDNLVSKIMLSQKVEDTIPDLKKEILEQEKELAKNKQRIKTNSDILLRYKDIKNKNIDSVDNINIKIKDLTIKLLNIDKTIPVYVDKNYIKEISHNLINLQEYFNTLLSDISSYNINMNVSEYNLLEKEITNLNNNIRAYNFGINKTQTELEYILSKKEEKVTCEKCNHNFSPYYSEEKNKLMVSYIEKLSKMEKEDNLKLKKLLENKDLYIKKQDTIKKFFDISKHNFRIGNIIESLMYDNHIDIQEDSLRLLKEINSIIDKSKSWIDYIEIKEQIRVLEQEKEFINNNINGNDFKSISELETVINRDIILLASTNDYIQSILYPTLKHKERVRDINKELSRNLSELDLKAEVEISKLKNELLREVADYIKSLKYDIESSIKKSDIIKEKVNMLKDEIKTLDNTSNVLREAINALSPNGGLIADSIVNFLSALAEDMNYIINSVWTYSMEILPCDLKDGELDYLFPVVSDGRLPTDDISETSKSMREIIDLAFKMVAMKYSNMEDFPLFLDEFGDSMDSVHKIKAYQAIDNIAITSFSQVFIVSHFAGVYNRFSDAETIVLDSKNIHLDENKTINKNIQFNTIAS